MSIDFLYKSLESCIIKSYTSGDFDNSVNQLGMSLNALNRLYTKDRFNGQDLNREKLKLLAEIQEVVDQRVFREMYGELH